MTGYLMSQYLHRCLVLAPCSHTGGDPVSSFFQIRQISHFLCGWFWIPALTISRMMFILSGLPSTLSVPARHISSVCPVPQPEGHGHHREANTFIADPLDAVVKRSCIVTSLWLRVEEPHSAAPSWSLEVLPGRLVYSLQQKKF